MSYLKALFTQKHYLDMGDSCYYFPLVTYVDNMVITKKITAVSIHKCTIVSLFADIYKRHIAIKFLKQHCNYLPLLTDDGHMVIKFDIVEETFKEDISYTNQVVVFLWLVKWICFNRLAIILKIYTSCVYKFPDNYKQQ